MACEEITVGSTPSCPLPPGGTRARFAIINFIDLDEETPYAETSSKVTGFTFKSTKKAFVFTGFRNDMKKSSEIIRPDVGPNNFKHNAGLIIYARTQAIKDEIEKLARGRFIIIAESKGKDADAIEALGLKCGLEAQVGVIQDAHANNGWYVLNFSTPEGEFEPKLPQTVGTDYANGISIFDTITA